MNVAYICHHGRPNYEQAWFAAMPVEKVKFITTAEPVNKLDDPNVEYCVVPYELKGWENRVFVSPKDASTTPRVFYKDFEQYLEDVDVVVVLEVFSSLAKQFIEYCHSVNKPVVVLVYELLDKHPIYYVPRYSWNKRYVLKHADHFVTVSHASARHLEKLGAPTDKISPIYPGIDMQNFVADRTNRDNRSLMFVGKLERHKGIDQTIAIYRRLLPDFPGLKLSIAGSGRWEPEVEALAAEYPGLVRFDKFLPHAELVKIINQHGVYIMPARDTKRYGIQIGAEQFGFSIVEAMACGLAAVTTNCGALAEIVTDKNIVCKQDDNDELYQRVHELLSSPERLTELSTYNEQLAKERYDIRKQASAFAELLQEVVELRHGN
jgi:glycosyltransferase involved in cell wall biosynthesis